MDPPSTLMCQLKPYQKQALYWMSKLEEGTDVENAASNLHPCWAAYCINDEYVKNTMWLKQKKKKRKRNNYFCLPNMNLNAFWQEGSSNLCEQLYRGSNNTASTYSRNDKRRSEFVFWPSAFKYTILYIHLKHSIWLLSSVDSCRCNGTWKDCHDYCSNSCKTRKRR